MRKLLLLTTLQIFIYKAQGVVRAPPLLDIVSPGPVFVSRHPRCSPRWPRYLFDCLLEFHFENSRIEHGDVDNVSHFTHVAGTERLTRRC